MDIQRNNLPIIYHRLPSGKIHVALIGVPIASITYSDTLKSFFVKFTHISDVVAECNSKTECQRLITDKVVEFLKDVLK